MTQNSTHTGKLYVVGTPIGNLGDLSPRVGEAFAAADAICCIWAFPSRLSVATRM